MKHAEELIPAHLHPSFYLFILCWEICHCVWCQTCLIGLRCPLPHSDIEMVSVCLLAIGNSCDKWPSCILAWGYYELQRSFVYLLGPKALPDIWFGGAFLFRCFKFVFALVAGVLPWDACSFRLPTILCSFLHEVRQAINFTDSSRWASSPAIPFIFLFVCLRLASDFLHAT